jgi:hypothetical protein
MTVVHVTPSRRYELTNRVHYTGISRNFPVALRVIEGEEKGIQLLGI